MKVSIYERIARKEKELRKYGDRENQIRVAQEYIDNNNINDIGVYFVSTDKVKPSVIVELLRQSKKFNWATLNGYDLNGKIAYVEIW